MTSQFADRITLELDRGEPIRGRLLDPGGAAHAFYGWLELATVLDRAWKEASAHRGGDEDSSGDR